MPRLNKKEVSKVKNQSGLYKIKNCAGKTVYVGSSKVLKHRIQSYYQKDDFSVNQTKEKLRPSACKFSFFYMPIKQARIKEKKIKSKFRYNVS